MKPVMLKIQPDDAQTVKDGWQVSRQRDFRGCETEAVLPEIVGRNQLLQMENVILLPSGYISSFPQLAKQLIVNASPGICLTLQSTGVYDCYYAPGNGVIYQSVLNSGSVLPIDMLEGTQTLVADAVINGMTMAVYFLGKYYCINANPDTSKNGLINLTDYTLITIPGHNAIKIKTYQNRIWVLNLDGTLQFSNNGDATTFDVLDILLLPNQEKILDFIPVQGGAIVYGDQTIYSMYGTTYQDINLVPLMANKQFTSGNCEVSGIAYILSTEGIYAAGLNGATLLPNNQENYLQSIYPIIAGNPGKVSAIHLKRFKAILYSWHTALGEYQSLVYYYLGNGYSKFNQLLLDDFPYMLALNDHNTDFIMGSIGSTVVRSTYPSYSDEKPTKSVIQTRHEDADSTRSKIWSEFTITMLQSNYGVTIDAYLDYSEIPIRVITDTPLSAGANLFNLDNSEGLAIGQNFPKSQTISFELTFDNSSVIRIGLIDETTGNPLIDETNENYLIFENMRGDWSIQELRLKYSLTGPDI